MNPYLLMSKDMSDRPDQPQKYYFAAGVFKLDYTTAGYPDLFKIVQEWAKDSNFYELIIRKVSSTNFGIQFVYIAKDIKEYKISQYKNQLKEQFKEGLYAVDYNETTSNDESIYKNIIILNSYS